MSMVNFWMRFRKGGVTGGARTDPNNPGADVVNTRFGSASKRRDVAARYSHGEGDVTPGMSDTVSVLCEIEVTNARDVSAISAALKKYIPATEPGGKPMWTGEDEVLLLPGAMFVVQDIQQRPAADQKPGRDPKAQNWYLVKLKQIA